MRGSFTTFPFFIGLPFYLLLNQARNGPRSYASLFPEGSMKKGCQSNGLDNKWIDNRGTCFGLCLHHPARENESQEIVVISTRNSAMQTPPSLARSRSGISLQPEGFRFESCLVYFPLAIASSRKSSQIQKSDRLRQLPELPNNLEISATREIPGPAKPVTVGPIHRANEPGSNRV